MRASISDLPIVFEMASVRVNDVRLLDAVDLTINAGRPTALVGPNGSGKTTLIRLGMGLAAPTTGRITWAGRTVAAADRRAIVFQRPVMLRRSVAANIGFALKRRALIDGAASRRTRIEAVLQRVGLEGLAQRPARRLSGGEQQRLALARALACNPEILFLDEPTASLDPAASKAVEDIIADVAASGIKVIIATHDLGQARRLAGDIVFLIRGRLAEHAPADQFFANPVSSEASHFLRGDLVV